jgi:hypothetical protein
MEKEQQSSDIDLKQMRMKTLIKVDFNAIRKTVDLKINGWNDKLIPPRPRPTC